MNDMATHTQGELPNSERLMDLEIRQLKEEMQTLKKQRALLQLRSEVAREKQLLTEAQQSLGLSPSSAGADGKQFTGALTSTNVDSNPDPDPNGHLDGNRSSHPPTEPSRGIKRRHSGSSESHEFLWNTLRGPSSNGLENTWTRPNHQGANNGVNNGANNGINTGNNNGEEGEEDVPPTFAVAQRYRLVNRKEYNTLIRFLEHYFSQFQRYYAPDYRKINEALRHVIPSIANTYNQFVAHEGSDRTWPQFCDFLQTRVKNKTDPASAHRHYYGSSQRQGQTVRDFARHLEVSEGNLTDLLPEAQRIQDLWDRILPDVRDEALPHQYQSTSYQDHVAHLHTIERGMPTRAHYQRKTPRRNVPAH